MKFQTTTNTKLSVNSTISTFESLGGNEYMLQLIGTDATLPFDVQLSSLLEEMDTTCSSLDAKVVFRRFFVSDSSNQELMLVEALSKMSVSCATSIIEQPPLSGVKISVWIYLQSGVEVSALDDGIYSVVKDGITHYWSSSVVENNSDDSRQQMRMLFDEYIDSIESKGCNLIDNCIRTWLFVHDIDSNYAGVVTGRNEIFDQQGLTPDTHFISSTGIQGRNPDHKSLVQMDAYSVKGISQEQIQFLYAPTHLNPTYEYGVSFERGTAVHYADRSHAFISGTASINNLGEVVHVGDVYKQTLRMWENVEALLAEADFVMEDIAHITLYLRDIAGYKIAEKMFEQRFPNTPKVIVLAPVCRKTWLIEMECIAIRSK